MKKEKDVHIMITTQDEVIKLSYDAWKDHVKECKDCQELMQAARDAEDKEQALWMVGFGCAMDMMRGGAIKPSVPPANPENN